MYICYVEESGDSGTFNIRDTNSNPFFIITGLFMEHSRLIRLTNDFLRIKARFFPSLMRTASHFLDGIELERKGGDIRKELRDANRRRRQQSIGFLDDCLRLLVDGDVRLLGKILVKNPGQTNNDAGFYGRSIMHVCEHFNAFLETKAELGFVIADSRRTAQNRRTTHTIFTQMHRANGNRYPQLAETPAYGHSNNFAMLQLSDILCSAIVFPMAMDVFHGHLIGSGNIHISTNYSAVRARYKDDVKKMQFMHRDSSHRIVGGLLVSDMTGLNRKTSLLFE